MTWEETIIHIRTQPQYKYLVEKAYFDEDLVLNVDRFKDSEEFKETLKLIKTFLPSGKKVLDIGCGNGISSIAFALNNFDVTAVEPDPSETVGAGAIRKLKSHYNLNNIEIVEAFAENINFPSDSFDIVYVRQAMHHANDLKKFIAECARVLRKGGVLLTVRDHVIFNPHDKEFFLENHPLQKFYGGENAFSTSEYRNAMKKAGLKILEELKYFDSIINFFPSSYENITAHIHNEYNSRRKSLFYRIGTLAHSKLVFALYNIYLNIKVGNVRKTAELYIPGRMYSYICKK